MDQVILVLLALYIGLYAGASLATRKWKDNARRIQRVAHKGEFYKVVKLDDPVSLSFFHVHEGDSHED